jgi:hypothetical protein
VRSVKIRELMQREGLTGEVVTLFHSRSTGIIHGDDGYDVTFNEESLVVGLRRNADRIQGRQRKYIRRAKYSRAKTDFC